MYTAARPPTPALCIEIDQSDVESCNDENENTKEEDVETAIENCKPTCNNGRILVGRWGRSKLSRRSSDPPEVIVNQARLHTRPPKPPLQFLPSSCKRTKLKEPKKVEKKVPNELINVAGDSEEVESDDGRLIASKVLPIMAMLLQRNEREESDEEKKKPEMPQNTNSSHVQPKLSVQCIQLLPSEPVTSRRH